MSNYIITGNLSSPQNVTSIEAWLREYCPVLRETDPDMRLTVAGRNPDIAIIKASESAGALVIPSPEDLSGLLQAADVYICPADNGSGIKLRVMDGLKFGLPVVAHSLAARGYEPFVGKSLFVYDEEASFRISVRRAVEAGFDRDSLIRQYKEIFSFEAGVKRLHEVLKGISQ